MRVKILFTFLFVAVLALSAVSAIEEVVVLDDYEVKFSYSGAKEDDTFTLRVAINNTSPSQKDDVLFEIDDADPFKVDGDEDWNVGIIGSGESEVNSFRIEVDSNTGEGKYDLEFSLKDSKDDYNEEVEIEIDSDKADLIIGDISSQPLIVVPDQEDVEFQITVENIGGGDATSVRAKLNLLSGIVSSSSYSDLVNLGTIASGESKTATFFVDVEKDVRSGNLRSSITLDYKTDSNEETDNLYFEIPVKGRPQFEIVSSSVDPVSLLSGESGKLLITVRNVGDEKAEETSVRVFENADLPLDFDEKTNFVGTLDENESGVAVFSFEVDSDAIAKPYFVKIQTRTLNKGNVMVSEHTVPVTISQPGPRNFSGLIFVSFLILVVVFISLLIFKRRK